MNKRGTIGGSGLKVFAQFCVRVEGGLMSTMVMTLHWMVMVGVEIV